MQCISLSLYFRLVVIFDSSPRLSKRDRLSVHHQAVSMVPAGTFIDLIPGAHVPSTLSIVVHFS